MERKTCYTHIKYLLFEGGRSNGMAETLTRNSTCICQLYSNRSTHAPFAHEVIHTIHMHTQHLYTDTCAYSDRVTLHLLVMNKKGFGTLKIGVIEIEQNADSLVSGVRQSE